jgi:integrase
MKFDSLRETNCKLISFMQENEYSKSYISRIRTEIRHILANAENCAWSSYAEIRKHYESREFSAQSLSSKRRILNLIERFDTNGKYPDGRLQGSRSSKYEYLNYEFKAIVDEYLVIAKSSGIKETTIDSRAHCVIGFLFHLQEAGCDSIDDISEKIVLSAFVSDCGTVLRRNSAKKSIAAVFKACIPQNPKMFTELLLFLPQLKTARKNIQYLTSDEVSSIEQVLNDKTSPLSLRDRAVAMLVLYTGLRKCDIVGLKINSIDWENDLIHVIQRKTKVPLTLPLRAVVGNAIHDYMELERPKIDCEYIFIRQRAPYREISSEALARICSNLMLAAGIRQNTGDRKGFHIFRHRLVTTLLGNGIPQPVISEITGQTSPASLDPYLYADFSHLRECALNVERFPISKEVFENV